jgi:nitroreductase
LDITVDELLTTTRCVRKRLDLTRRVDLSVVEECVALAQQAPTGADRQHWHFIAVTDASQRERIAELYRSAIGDLPRRSPDALVGVDASSSEIGRAARLLESGRHLAENLERVPVLMVACIEAMGEHETAPGPGQWASVFPAIWSFMLAARSRGLGTCLTTIHLHHEREVADLLAIPFPRVRQAALIPVAHTIGSDFRPAVRRPTSEVLHWNGW